VIKIVMGDLAPSCPLHFNQWIWWCRWYRCYDACLQLDEVHSRQTSALSLTNATPTMEVAMLVHSIEKIVSVRYFPLL